MSSSSSVRRKMRMRRKGAAAESSSGSEDEDGSAVGTVVPPASARRRRKAGLSSSTRKKPRKETATPALSFTVDDEEDGMDGGGGEVGGGGGLGKVHHKKHKKSKKHKKRSSKAAPAFDPFSDEFESPAVSTAEATPTPSKSMAYSVDSLKSLKAQQAWRTPAPTARSDEPMDSEFATPMMPQHPSSGALSASHKGELSGSVRHNGGLGGQPDSQLDFGKTKVDRVIEPALGHKQMISVPPVATVLARMDTAVQTARTRTQRHQSEFDRLVGDQNSAKRSISLLKENLQSVATRYDFFRGLRVFSGDLTACLTEKRTIVDEIANASDRCHREQFEAIMQRARLDECDECAEAAVAGCIWHNRADSGVDAASQAARALQRARRRAKASHRGASGLPRGLSGISSAEQRLLSDENSDSEEASFRTKVDALQKRALVLFVDVLPEFSSVSTAASQFALWKKTDPGSYAKAFAVKSLADVVGVFVRSELLHWNVLTDEPAFERFEWFRALWSYGEDSAEDDPDQRLIPDVVAEHVAPYVRRSIRHRWNPFSARQTARAVEAVEELKNFEVGKPALEGIIAAFVERVEEVLEACSANVVEIPLGATAAAETLNGSPGWLAPVSVRSLNRVCRLVANVAKWVDVASDEILSALCDAAVTRLVAPLVAAMSKLAVDGIASQTALECHTLYVDALSTLLSSVPARWFASKAINEHPGFNSLLQSSRRVEGASRGGELSGVVSVLPDLFGDAW